MKVYMIFYASLLTQVYAKETNPLLNLFQGFNEPAPRQKQTEISQNKPPADPFDQFQYNEEPVDKSLLREFYQEPVTEKATKSECQYWCVTPEKKFYCCDGDDSDTDIDEHHGVCPVIRQACHVSDVNPSEYFPRKDGNHVPFPDIFKDDSDCIISSEVLKHLHVYHQKPHKVYNGNISVIEVFDLKHKRSILVNNIFGDISGKYGVYRDKTQNHMHVRPFFRAIKLAVDIGTVAKVIHHIPYLTKDPARDHYNDQYIIYDSYLPEDKLTSDEYETLIYQDTSKSNKDKPILLSRIARYIYELS